jgi:threonine synthase
MLTRMKCLECGQVLQLQIDLPACTNCESPWLEAEYDYANSKAIWQTELSRREMTLWRYKELLPVETPSEEVTMGENLTPLFRLYPYEQQFNHPYIYVKDERRNPTSSFKDRQAAIAVTAMQQAGVTECAMATAGNAGIAYAAYCARANIKLWLFVSSRVPNEKMREIALYGAEVVKVSGTYDEAKRVAAEFARHRGIHLERGAKSIPSRESMKTLAFEIAEQLGMLHTQQPGTFQSPDWYLQAVSGGIGPIGVWNGFQDLKAMGLIDYMPKLAIVQAAGCAPMVQAFSAGQKQASAVVPSTLISVLATGDPGYSYVQLREAVLSNGGTMLTVEDGEAFQAMRHLARRAGIAVEPATAVAFAGLERMLTDGTIKPGERVVVNCTGHTMPVESYILDDQYVLELDNQEQEEGLTTAFQTLYEQVTSILIVDDNPSDRRLIKRLLQRQKRYRVFEANNGVEALRLACDLQPDLIVSDLTMPEMDGFALLEKLKSTPETSDIPVVVISAKALDNQDYAALKVYSHSVWTKGNFDTRQLTKHVIHLLGDEPIDVIKPEFPEETTEHSLQSTTDCTILVIDDDPRHQRLSRRLLETGGNYSVLTASTGSEGWELVVNETPQLILLDLMMPDMDGFELLERIQQDETLCNIPVIVVSGKELDSNERTRLRASIRSLVRKTTIDRKQFLAMINNALAEG